QELTGDGARRDRCLASQFLDRVLGGQMMHHKLPDNSEPLIEWFGGTAGYILCLSTAAVGGGDQAPRGMVRCCDPEFSPQDVQTEVDSGGCAGGGEYAALVDEEHVLLHLHLRVGVRERARVVPVGGRPAAVQQSGGGQGESTGGDGRQPRSEERRVGRECRAWGWRHP